MIKDWWKWGNASQYKHLEDYPKLKLWLETRWNTSLKKEFKAPIHFSIPEVSEKKKEQIRDIFASITTKRISFREDERLKASIGKSYFDNLQIFKGQTPAVPDAIITPNSHHEVEYILLKASEHQVAVVPFCGSSNQVGATRLEEIPSKFPFKISLNLQLLNKALHVDEENMTATFQAGIKGPDLEKYLAEKGYTLGHFPHNFECSSLGGWVATRSAGTESSYYGKIEDLVDGLKVATPSGTIYTSHFTHDAMGVNTLSLFLGSEGSLGVMTEVRVKIRKRSRTQRWIVALLPDFESGAAVLKELVQHEIKPSVVRFSDPSETALIEKISDIKAPEGFLDNLKNEAQKIILGKKNFKEPHFLLLRFEELLTSTSTSVVKTKSVIELKGGVILDQDFSKSWEKMRFSLPYWKDTLLEHHVFIDTYETIVPWNKVSSLYYKVKNELQKCDAFGKEKGIPFAHLSSIYPTGVCIQFHLLCPLQSGREIEQCKELKELMTDLFIKFDASISHHNGIGLRHKKWYLKYNDPLSTELLNAIKHKLDPKSILNPGKLFY